MLLTQDEVTDLRACHMVEIKTYLTDKQSVTILHVSIQAHPDLKMSMEHRDIWCFSNLDNSCKLRLQHPQCEASVKIYKDEHSTWETISRFLQEGDELTIHWGIDEPTEYQVSREMISESVILHVSRFHEDGIKMFDFLIAYAVSPSETELDSLRILHHTEKVA